MSFLPWIIHKLNRKDAKTLRILGRIHNNFPILDYL